MDAHDLTENDEPLPDEPDDDEFREAQEDIRLILQEQGILD